MIPSLAELREHIETDLSDSALQRLIDREAAEVAVRFGSPDIVVDDIPGGDLYLSPSRIVGTVQSVKETVGTTETTLATNDHVLRFNGTAIERLSTGTNSRTSWGDRVRITYAPSSAEYDIRKGVIIDLVKLAIQYNAVKSEVGGQNHEVVYHNYQQERLNILSTLEAGQRQFS